MNIALTPDLAAFVSQQVESGRYQDPSELICAGLRLLREQDELHQHRLDELRREIAIGIAQAERGEVAPLNAQQTLARLRQEQQAETRQGP